MIREMKAFVSSLGNSSNEIEKDMLETTLEAYRSFGIEALGTVLKEMKENNTEDEIITEMLSNLGLGRKTTDIEKIQKLINFSTEVINHSDELTDLLEALPGYFTDKSITLKSAATLDTFDDLSTMANYITNITLLVAMQLANREYYTDKQYKKFVSLKSAFNQLFTLYNLKLGKRINTLNNLSDVVVSTMSDDDLSKKDKELDSVTSNFRGNPIFHIRKAWVDIQMWRIQNLKDKKQMFESTIIELRLKREKGDTKKIDKQIEYYQKKINETDYKIHKLSEV